MPIETEDRDVRALYRRAAHAVFDQIHKYHEDKRTRAYELLTKLNPNIERGEDGNIHFGEMSSEECVAAITKLLSLCQGISLSKAEEVARKYFGEVHHQGHIEDKDELVIKLQTTNLYVLEKKLEDRNQLYASNRSASQARKFNNEDQDTSDPSKKRVEDYLRAIFVQYQGSFDFDILKDDPEIKKWGNDDVEDLRRAFVVAQDKINKEENRDKTIIDLVLEDFMSSLKWRYEGQYIEFILSLKNKKQDSQTKESVVRAATSSPVKVEKKTLAASAKMAPKAPPKKGGKKSGQNDDDAFLDAYLSKMTVSGDQASFQEISDLDIKKAITDIRKINSKDENYADSLIAIHEQISDLVNKAPEGDKRLFFVFCELMSLVGRSINNSGRIHRFDDLIGVVVGKMKSANTSAEKTEFLSLRKSVIKPTKTIVADYTYSYYVGHALSNMIVARYDNDLISSFLSNHPIEDLDLPEFISIAAHKNPQALLPLLKALEKSNKSKLLTDNNCAHLEYIIERFADFPDIVGKALDIAKPLMNWTRESKALENIAKKIIVFSPQSFEKFVGFCGESVLFSLSKKTKWNGFSFLTLASFFGEDKVVERILASAKSKDEKLSLIGATDETNQVPSPMIMAAQEGNEDVIKVIAGVIINSSEEQKDGTINQDLFDALSHFDDQGYNVIMSAASSGHLNVVVAILDMFGEKGSAKLKTNQEKLHEMLSSPNDAGGNIFTIAAQSGYVAILRELSDRLENRDAIMELLTFESDAGYTPLACAIAKNMSGAIGEILDIAIRIGGIDAAKELVEGSYLFDPENQTLVDDQGIRVVEDLSDDSLRIILKKLNNDKEFVKGLTDDPAIKDRIEAIKPEVPNATTFVSPGVLPLIGGAKGFNLGS